VANGGKNDVSDGEIAVKENKAAQLKKLVSADI